MSPVSIYEAAVGLARKRMCPLAEARELVDDFIRDADIEVMAVDANIGQAALDAFQRFGKGRHKAALNMGDCFAYACAKSRNMPLLFKGDDFVHTDIAVA